MIMPHFNARDIEPNLKNHLDDNISQGNYEEEDQRMKLDFAKENKFVIHNYEVVNYIGEGSFGKVYLCIDIYTGIRYALKVQNKQQIDNAQTETK